MLFDAATVEAVSGAIPRWLAIVLLFVSFLGSVYLVVPGVGFAVLLGDRYRTTTWPGIMIGGYGLFITLKPLFSVSRPPVEAPFGADVLPAAMTILYDLGLGVSSASFPSGHAIAATVFWGLVAVDCSIGTRRVRICGSALVVAFVGLSRVALGVHYPGDVLAGIALGLAYLAGVLVLRARVSRPARTMLLFGSAVALGGLVSGRYGDAVVLLAAATATGAVLHYWSDATDEPLEMTST